MRNGTEARNTMEQISQGRNLRKKTSFLLKSAMLAALGLTPAVASADLIWDLDGATTGATGGTGVWDTTNLRWFDTDTSTHVAWPVGGDKVAVFDAAGSLTLGTSVSVNALRFDVDGYTIAPTAAETLTLIAGTAFSTPAISVTNLGQTATINASVLGSAGLYKAGGGTLVLGGNSASLAGDVTISDGTLRLDHASGLGAGITDVTINFGTTLDYNAVAGSMSLASVTTFGGANLRVGDAGSNVTLASVTSFGTGLTKQGAGKLTLSAANPNHFGDTILQAGTLVIGHSDAMQNSVLELQGGTVDVGTLTAVTVGGLRGAVGLALDNTVPGPVTLTLNNAIDASYDGALTGGGSLVKTGFGTQTLNGVANTYAGTTTINNGTLAIAAATSISAAGLILNGGTLSASGATAITLANPITIGGDFGLGQSSGGTGALTLTSNLDLGGVTRTITVNNPTDTLSGIISNGALTKQGSGTLVLSGANTYSGATTINSGVLSISAANNLGDGSATNTIAINGGTLRATTSVDLGAGRAVTVSNGTFDTNGAATVLTVHSLAGSAPTKVGDGTLELAGAAANTYAGTFIVNRGTLLLSKTSGVAITGDLDIAPAGGGGATLLTKLMAANQIASTGNVIIRGFSGIGGGNLDLNNFDQTIAGLTIINNQGTGSTTVQTGTGTLTVNGNLSISGSSAATNPSAATGLTGNHIAGNLNLGGAARTFDITAAGGATISAIISNGSIVKTGSAQLSLGAINNIGALTINNGTVRATADGAIPADIPLVVSATDAGTTATLNFNNFNYTLTAANNLQFGGGAGGNTIATGTGTLTLNTNITLDATNNPTASTISGKLDLGGASRTFTVGDSSATATDLIVSAAISGAGDIIKEGAGTMSLRAQNTTWAGSLRVNAGTIRFDAGLSDNTQFNNIMGAAGNNIFVDGTKIEVAMHTTGNVDRSFTNRTLNVGAGGVTIDVAGSYPSFTEGLYSQLRFTNTTGNLVGTGSMTKNGGGRLQFQTAAPNFSGPIIVNDGTLEASGATLGDASATNTITINGGNLALTGTATQPQITLNGGALSITGGSRAVSSQVNVTSASYTFLNDFYRDNGASQNMTINGKLTGSAPLGVAVNRVGYDANSGSLILTNNTNDYSGTITVGKNLKLQNNSATGSGRTIGSGEVILAGGSLVIRDNGAGSNSLLAYGNNVSIIDPSGIFANGDLPASPAPTNTATIDLDRSTGTNTGNTIQLGTLTMAGQQLNVTGTNGYGVAFNGLTTLTGSPTLNVTAGTMTLAGGVAGTGQTITKTGAGTLKLQGVVDIAGLTLTAGSVETSAEPAGSGRTLALPLGTGFGAGVGYGGVGGVTQANLIDRVTLDSEGVIAIGIDSTFNPDFSLFTAGPNSQRLRFGATSNATLTGTITPHSDNIVRLGGGGATLTLASANAVSGAVSLDVNTSGTAAGTVVLGAANNFSGPISIGGGMTLRAAQDASLGTSVAAIAIDNGTLVLANGGDFTNFSTRKLSIGAGGATLDTDGNNVSLTEILGTGAFTKAGAGRLTLATGNANFSGASAITGGIVNIQNAVSLGTATSVIPVSAGAALEIQGGITLARPVSIAGTGVGDTGALHILSGANTISGAVTFGAGASLLVDAGASVTLSAAISGASPVIGGAGNITLSASTPGGTNNMTKVGAGTLTLTADPNQTGTFTINDGTVALSHTSGSTDCNFVVNPGGTLILNRADGIGDAYDITLNDTGTFKVRQSDTIDQLLGDGIVNAEGATAARTLSVTAAGGLTTFNGTIADGGSFALGFTKGSSANTLVLTGANTYTGATTVGGGTLRIEGNAASIAGSTQITLNRSDTILILGSNADTNATVDRVKDTTEIEMQDGSNLIFNGANDLLSPTTEAFGQLETNTGHNTVTLLPAAGAQIAVTGTTLLRSGSGTLLIRGTGLGGSGADSSRLFFTTAPTAAAFVGGAGAPGSTNQSIIPFVVGDTSATGSGRSLVTYDATSGVRPLTASEYATTIADGVISTNNVSLAAPAALANRVTAINSLRLDTAGAVNIGAGGTLRVASGAILDASATGGTISGGAIIYGTQPAVFQLSGETAATPITTVVNSNISGSGGLSVSAANPASVLALGGFNNITGEIAINKGVLRLDSPNALNPFSRVTFRFSSEANTANAVLRLNGQTSVEAFFAGSGYGVIENGGATPATIGFTLGSDTDTTNLTLRDGGSAPLNIIKMGGSRVGFQNDSSITGTVTVREGTFELKDGSDFDSLGAVVVEGGAFKVYNQSGNNNTDRLPAGLPVTLRGGTFYADTDINSTNSFSERVGKLTVEAGVNNAQVDWHTTATRTSLLWFWDPAGVNATDSIARNPGAVLNLVAAGTAGVTLGSTAQAMLRFGTDLADPSASLLKNGILHKNGVAGWAVVGDNFPTVSGDLVATGNIEHSMTALNTYQTSTDATAWLATDNVKLSSAVTVPLAAPATINSLILADGINLDLNAQTLTVDTGGILAITTTASGPTKTISNGTLTAGDFAGSELVIRAGDNANTANAAGVNISATIADASVTNRTALTKWGGKTLTLSGPNTFTGNVYVPQGTLAGTSADNFGPALPGRTLVLGGNAILDLSGATSTVTLPFDTIIVPTGTTGGSTPDASGEGVIRSAKTQMVNFNGVVSGIGSLRLDNAAQANFTAPITLSRSLTVGDNDDTTILTALPMGAAATLAAGVNNLGGLNVGLDQRVGTLTQTSGTLKVGMVDPSLMGDVNIGYRNGLATGTGSASATKGTVNLAGTTLFHAEVVNFRMGVVTASGSNGGADGHLIIGQDSIIRTGAFVVGDSPNSGNAGTASDIVFGSGDNLVEVATSWIVGGRKSTGAVTIASGGTLTFSGIGGAPGNLSVGVQENIDTGVNAIGTLNMTGGTFIANIDTLRIGDKNRSSASSNNSGGSTGTLTLGTSSANSVVANSLILGRMQRSTGSGFSQGTINLGGGSFEVLGNATLGDWSDDSGTHGGARGNLNLTGGTFSVFGDIVKIDNNRSAAMITVDGGTLDMQIQTRGDIAPGAITASQLAYRSGSIVDAASITLDGRGVTDGATFPAIDAALIVRDVTLATPVSLTNATADKGGILYEAAGAGTGGTLSGPLSLGVVGRTINVEDSAGAANDLTISGAVTGTTLTKTGAGHLVLSGTQSYTALINNAGKTTLNTALGTGASTVTANSADGVVFGANQKLATLTVAGGTGAWTGKVDMKDSALVVAAGGATLANTIDQVKQGRANGAWNGNGISSSAAAADPLKITGVGVIVNNDGSDVALKADLDGQATVLNDILVKYTYNGDANLSGTVTADDYFLIDAGFIAAGAKTGWYNGDFDYNGVIDIDDYFLIDVAYARQTGPLSGGDLAPVAPSAPSAAVPEPGTLSLLALGAAALLGRRRRK